MTTEQKVYAMHDLKADFLNNIDRPLWCLSIDEAHALVTIASEITGITVTTIKSRNRLQVWVDGSSFEIIPVSGTYQGDWSGDNCTDTLVLNPFPNALHNMSFNVSLSEGLKACEFVFLVIQNCIMRLHNPFVKTRMTLHRTSARREGQSQLNAFDEVER